jgi:arabinofuranosyltransferase
MLLSDIHFQNESANNSPYSYLNKYWPTAVLLAIFWSLAIYNSFLCDDAFITFRFAKNLVAGFGPVFNAGERVEGYTNFFWMLLMAVVIKLGAFPELWSRILSIAFSSGTLLIFTRSLPNNENSGITKYLFAALLVFSLPFFVWSTGGLETAAFTFFMFAGITYLINSLRDGSDKDSIKASLMFALASLTRPEGILVFGLAACYLFILAGLKRNSFHGLVLFISPFIILYGTYFIWKFNYYGKLFPNTFYIKSPGFSMVKFGLLYYWNFIIKSAVWLPTLYTLFVIIKSKMYRLNDSDIYLALLFIFYSIYVIFVGGDFMVSSRFLMPLLPPLYLLLHSICVSKVKAGRGKFNSILAIFMIAAFISINSYSCLKARQYKSANYLDSIGALESYVIQWSSGGRLISQNSQPTDTIAVTAAGTIPYYSNLYTIDMHGLTAPNPEKYLPRDELVRPGHVLMISMRYLFELKPQFVMGHPQITPKQPQQHPFGKPQDINPILRTKYTAASAPLPGLPGLYLNFWVRDDIISRISPQIKLYSLAKVE